MKDKTKNIVLWSIIILVLVSVVSNFSSREEVFTNLSYSNFVSMLEESKVNKVTLDKGSDRLYLSTVEGKNHMVVLPSRDTNLFEKLTAKGISLDVKEAQKPSLLMELLIHWLPFLILVGVWVFFFRSMSGGGKGGFNIGKSKAKMLNNKQIKVRFTDVAGVDEAKDEVYELVEFLREPAKFNKLGAKIPSGVLMVGEPGTGKTLLAKAIAGEAECPFFNISGSDFVEMFVGVGAARVRDMFAEAKKNAPCIIFIDEIDAVGRQRGAGMSHDEREQTLNQLLVEMDGFEGNEGVVVIAATNRPEILDKALLRPGRFDRRVHVGLPDIKGREQILDVHMKKVPLDKNVDKKIVARGTPGFSGADLANLVNEAALVAAKNNLTTVTMSNFDKAKDKIILGSERRSMVMSEKEKRNTAYHEAGHAIVGLLVEEHTPLYKVTIIPHGRALGLTVYIPEEDRYSTSKQELECNIASLYGGRIAEELTLGVLGVTTGASNDIEKATDIARRMVISWGLSDLGAQNFLDGNTADGYGTKLIVAGNLADKVDAEVKSILDRNYKKAEKILNENIDKLHVMAEALLKYETIDRTQIDDIMAGKPVTEPKDDSGEGVAETPKDETKSSSDNVFDLNSYANRNKKDDSEDDNLELDLDDDDKKDD